MPKLHKEFDSKNSPISWHLNCPRSEGKFPPPRWEGPITACFLHQNSPHTVPPHTYTLHTPHLYHTHPIRTPANFLPAREIRWQGNGSPKHITVFFVNKACVAQLNYTFGFLSILNLFVLFIVLLGKPCSCWQYQHQTCLLQTWISASWTSMGNNGSN